MVSGMLWRDSLIMMDRETETLWSHVTGEAIRGPLEGTRLEAIPVAHTTWKPWRAAHPDTRALAKEWGRYRVNVNCVAFGLIDTRMTAARDAGETVPQGGAAMGMPAEMREAIIKATPLGRAGSPEDAAGAVCLLCLPEADFITGQLLVASGGYMQ